MAYDEKKWKEAKKLCRLNEEDIRIAKAMGLNPKSLIKNIPNSSQKWKAPVKDWLWSMWGDRQEKAEKRKKKKAAAEAAGDGVQS